MTSKKKLRSLLGGTLFMVLMLSVHPTTVSASAVGSSTVMDQSVETEDQQSGMQSETQTAENRMALPEWKLVLAGSGPERPHGRKQLVHIR